MKKIILASSFFMMLIFAQFSLAMSTRPAKCPGVSALRAAVFVDAYQDEEGIWELYATDSNFDTKEEWHFIMHDVFANGRQDAFGRGAEALKSMSYREGPTLLAAFNLWVCYYNTAEGYNGVAMMRA